MQIAKIILFLSISVSGVILNIFMDQLHKIAYTQMYSKSRFIFGTGLSKA